MTPDLSHYAPIVIRTRITVWERAFLASIIAQQRRGVKLSEKQLATLAPIVRRFQERVLRGEVVE